MSDSKTTQPQQKPAQPTEPTRARETHAEPEPEAKPRNLTQEQLEGYFIAKYVEGGQKIEDAKANAAKRAAEMCARPKGL